MISYLYNIYKYEERISYLGHSPTGAQAPAPAPAKPRHFFTPRPRPNVFNDRGVLAGVYLFLLEKEPRRNSGKAPP